MGRSGMWGRMALAVALTAAGITSPSAAEAASGPGPDAHYFLMKATASGEYTADYGDERLEPGQTTASGVDGAESGSWSWKIRAVGRSLGNGPLRSAAAEFKGSATHSAEIISYGIQMGELGETQLCDGEDAPPSETFSYHEGFRGERPRPRWISSPSTAIQYRSGGFAVGYPGYYGLVKYCFHGLPPGLTLYSFVLPTETPVPRGAFEPRSDRSFSGSWSDSVNELDDSDGSAVHSETGSSELEITVKSVSERKATKKRDKYRDPDPHDGIYGFD